MGRITTSDAELVEASRRGERAAFGELVARYQRIVCAVGYSGTSDRSLGEDVAQDTFVTAFHQLDQLRDVSRVREWLCGIARNLARKARRVRAREDVIDEAQPDANASPFDVASEQERDAVVAAALERVPETYREALVLYYVEQRSVATVASALGISADAVHQRLSRGRQLVAAEVAELVEHTLERRRTRRNLVVAVIAALPVVTPSHANASNTGGTSMSKIGIAALLMAAVGGTGYAVHRAHAGESAAQTAPGATSTSATQAASRGTAQTPAKHSRAAFSVNAPPSLPPTSAASQPPYDCAAVAQHFLVLAQQSANTKPPLMLTGEEADKLRDVVAASGSAFVMVIDGSGSTTTSGRSLPDTIEQQCLSEHWSQSQIDCLATANDFSSTMPCSGDGSAAGEPPTAAELAAVTDASCPAVAAHIASLIAPLVPTIPDLGSDDVSSVVIAAMNSLSSELPAQIEASCTSGDWAEPMRRCFAASSSPSSLEACN